MLTRIFLILLIGISFAADAPKKGASENDLKQLQGAWYIVEFPSEPGASTVPATPTNPPDLVFRGDRLELFGQKAGSFSIDATSQPKRMDWDVVRIAKDGGRNLGIYKLEGIRLTICQARPGVPRPTDFTAKKGSGRSLTVYERDAPH